MRADRSGRAASAAAEQRTHGQSGRPSNLPFTAFGAFNCSGFTDCTGSAGGESRSHPLIAVLTNWARMSPVSRR